MEPDPTPHSLECAVDAGAQPGPFPTTFQFRNDTAAPLFLFKACIGLDYGIGACSSGFRQSLGPQYHCACECDQVSCRGVPACGPCPPSEGIMVPVGASVAADWNGMQVEDDQKTDGNGALFACVRPRVLPPGRYRVAVRVFDDLTSAAAHSGGRVVTHDFVLPSPTGEVDVPLAVLAADQCDPAPGASTPLCSGAEPRDRPCSLSEKLTFAWQGGNSPTVESDSSELTPPATYGRRRVFRDSTPDLTCSTSIPRCARDSRVVTTSDIVRVIDHPEIAAAFAAGTTPVYGYDSRVSDGTILIIYRQDGTSLGIGDECPSCARPLTAAMRAVVSVLGELRRQGTASAACSLFDPPQF